jgi:hypothetical protein
MRYAFRQRAVFARAAAGLAAFALFAGPLFEAAHEASVQHVTCPEDGELIDAPAQAAHAHAPQASEGAQLFSERDQSPSSPGSGHDHCALALRSHVRGCELSAKRLAAPIEGIVLAGVSNARPILTSRISLYRLAPKSGPPQA